MPQLSMGAPSVPLACVGGSMRRPDPEAELDKTLRLGIATRQTNTGSPRLGSPVRRFSRRRVRRLRERPNDRAGATLMSNSNRTPRRNPLKTMIAAGALFAAAIAGAAPAHAAGACALVPNEKTPSEKILQCGDNLTVRPAPGAHYQPLYKKGVPLPVAIRLTNGALLIEYHPASPNEKFQILTPLAIAAVRGTKWAMDVTKAQTSTLVLDGSVAVTNRRLNQFVVLTQGQGVDITPTDTSVIVKTWGEARVRAPLSRFGE
jgi:ferric-dicitrate binding protein FerR (iron transport regulator)